MCDCGNNCGGSCKIPVGPIGPAGPKGDTGEQGANGANGAQGEQGETGAQGEQGIAGDSTPLEWLNFNLINGWTQGHSPAPQYAIRNGLLYTRGELVVDAGTSSGVFALLDPTGWAVGLKTTIGGEDSPIIVSTLDWSNTFTKELRIVDWNAGPTTWFLDSVPVLSIK